MEGKSKKDQMNILEKDAQYIWHPLTQHKKKQEILPIEKAKGVFLYDENDKAYIDGISSWYTAVYGHCNEFILEAVKTQMETLDQVVFTGFTHKPAVKLAEALIGILPKGQQKIFFNDNGSTSTEIGIKMALQYHFNLDNDRKTMLAFEEGFHGDTFGAMSVSGLSVYNGAFEDHFIEVKRIPVPNGENTQEILQKIKKIHEENPLAGFIYEPLVQGAAAMKMHDKDGLNEILILCNSLDIVLVADEVMTGFGKTGSYFASDFMKTKPDVICLSKALTAGLLPMGATTCSQKIYDAFYDDEIAKGLFHGHTYTANPLACTTALAGIQLLTSSGIQENIKRIMASHQSFGEQITTHPKVRSIRQQGVIFALELNVEFSRYGNMRDEIYQFFMNQGVYLRPLGNIIYILAPFIIEQKELKKIYASIENLLNSKLINLNK